MKVDALYISTDVMIAQRIDSLNERYGSSILMSGDFYEMLSKKGQESVRQLDQVIFKENYEEPVEIWCFEIKDILPIKEEIRDDDEETALNEDKVNQRQRGAFVKHVDFEDYGAVEHDGNEDPFKELSDLEKVFEMDHDFRCILKQRNEELELIYQRGLKDYIEGDWISALVSFQQAKDKYHDYVDKPLNYIIGLIEKHGSQKPENWKNGYDID